MESGGRGGGGGRGELTWSRLPDISSPNGGKYLENGLGSFLPRHFRMRFPSFSAFSLFVFVFVGLLDTKRSALRRKKMRFVQLVGMVLFRFVSILLFWPC